MCEHNVGRCAGYERHKRRGEVPCRECVIARNWYMADRKRQIKAGTWHLRDMYGRTSLVLLDHLETFGAMTTKVLTLQLEDRFQPKTVRRTLYRMAARGQLTKREDWDGQSRWAAA